MVLENAKSTRRSGDCVVLHGTPEWSQTHIEGRPATIAANLLDAFQAAAATTLPPSAYQAAYCWRHAMPANPLRVGALVDTRLPLVACGDWAAGGRVEDAWRSGVAAAGRVLGGTAHWPAANRLVA
jgi:predicted NAD/FAD-dependent oxidoreductase